MKRLVLSLVALLIAAGPLATGAAMAREHGGWEHDRGRRGEREAPPGWVRDGRGGWERAPVPPEYYGPPPGAYPGPRAYGVRRGGYLPPEVRGGIVGDYGRYRLRPPPRGYTWVRVGNAFLLMNMATGQIFDVIED